VAITRVVCSHDCGLIVNPDGVTNQVEGNIIQGVSRALFEEVTFDANGVTSLDWNSYPILRFTDVPDLEIVLINRPEWLHYARANPPSSPSRRRSPTRSSMPSACG
jgi:nicotinate dehydrogenase subunit B